MAGIFTYEIFDTFQKELEHYPCTTHKIKEEAVTINFFVKNFSVEEECLVELEVTYNDFNQEASCSCKLFESYAGTSTFSHCFETIIGQRTFKLRYYKLMEKSDERSYFQRKWH